MIIYRLENADGVGPYSTPQREIVKYLRWHREPVDMLPPTGARILVASMKDFVYGWRTLALMRKWARPTTWPKIMEAGFRIIKYDVDSLYFVFPDGQMLFCKDVSVHSEIVHV